MEITMFGSLAILDGDRRLGPGDLGGTKPRQVLELLLLARGRLVCTDMLADALWPEDSQPRNVVATLNTYVCVLRQRMFTDRLQARRVLVTGSGAYRIAVEELDVDRDTFDRLLVCAEQAPRAERLRLLTEAADLYAGELLEHARYEEWVQDERRVYADRATRAHLTLARDWLMEGEPPSALRHAEMARGLAKYSEEAFRLIMLANHELGHHDIVRRTFDQCRNVLWEDLGVAPSHETVQTSRAIEARVPVREVLASAYRPTPSGAPRDPAGRSVA